MFIDSRDACKVTPQSYLGLATWYEDNERKEASFERTDFLQEVLFSWVIEGWTIIFRNGVTDAAAESLVKACLQLFLFASVSFLSSRCFFTEVYLKTFDFSKKTYVTQKKSVEEQMICSNSFFQPPDTDKLFFSHTEPLSPYITILASRPSPGKSVVGAGYHILCPP